MRPNLIYFPTIRRSALHVQFTYYSLYTTHFHLTFCDPVIPLTTRDSPLSSCLFVRLPAHAHLCICIPTDLVFIFHHCLKMFTIEERAQAQAGVSHSPPLYPCPLLFSSSPPPPLRAPSLLCALDTSWHAAKSPGHLSAPLSYPLCSGTDGEGPFVASLSLQQVPYSKRQEAASHPACTASLAQSTVWCAHFISRRRQRGGC